jgi:hypothetical protein
LDGNACDKLRDLNESIREIINQLDAKQIAHEKKQALLTLWGCWTSILDVLKLIMPTTEHIQTLEKSINTFETSFINIFGKGQVTPYIHILCCHVIAQIQRLGTMQIASQQKFEAYHRTSKALFYERTTRGGFGHDPSAETLGASLVQKIVRNYAKLDVYSWKDWMAKHIKLWKHKKQYFEAPLDTEEEISLQETEIIED